MTITTEAAIERWDERYAVREYIWNAGPNQFVERYLADLEPAIAVDLAAGEGRNAVWLAEQGWTVTAVDFSPVGLRKAAQLAADRDVTERVTTIEADALTYEPAQPVDLVIMAYLQIPLEQRRVVLTHAATWLAPGGRLMVVAHDRTNVDAGYGGPSDPDHCYDLAETVTALAGLEMLTAEVAQRHVETDEGPRTALDTLVIARRPKA